MNTHESNKEVSKIRVLVVDDEPSIVASVLQYLDRRGFQVAGVTSASLAEELLNTGVFEFAIVDLRLGQDSGLALLRRALSKNYRGEYIIITAFSEDFASELTEADRKRLIEKPFKLYSIVDRIKELTQYGP